MSKLMNFLEVAKDFVQERVESTVTTVEQVHLAIADASFNLAPKGRSAETLASAREKHHQAVQGVYETIRRVNRSLGELANDYFEGVEDGQATVQTMNQADQQATQAAPKTEAPAKSKAKVKVRAKL